LADNVLTHLLQYILAMKIALYVPSWPPGSSSNGIVTYASHIVPALRSLGHEVFIVTGRSSKDAENTDTISLTKLYEASNFFAKVKYRIAPDSIVPSLISLAVRDLVSNVGIDVFEIEESFGWSLATSRLNIVPVVVRLHGPSFLTGQFDRTRNAKKIALEGRAIRNANYVTACSADVVNAVKRFYDLSLPKSRVIPNPVDSVTDRQIWNRDQCNPEGILFVGRFDAVKGGDLVLRAFATLAEARPQLQLTFVGPDRGLAQADEYQSLSTFVRENIPEAVRSRIDLRGQVSHSEVTSLRTQHFLTVVASRYESQPYVVMEALSRGCPLVATAVGGIPEFVADRYNGLLVPGENVEALASACKLLLDNKDLAARIGRQAWVSCRELYSPESIAKQTISAYQDAIKAAKYAPNL
jgi:glycosyltransferase involved in cell wall biosynthesis